MPFIFSRRYIQECLDRLSGSLTKTQINNLVARLNKKSDDRLSAMWEAVMLDVFSGFPKFRHEEPLTDGRKPDFQCELPKSGALIVGDITSVSDKGYHEENPVDFFLRELERVAKKHGSDLSQFHVQVDGLEEGSYDRRKVKLLLPEGNRRAEFFKNELEPYIKERLRTKDYGHKQLFQSEGSSIEIEFAPKSNLASWGHPSYTTVLNIDRNPIWNRLKDKAEQLKNAPEGAVRLVLLCDGGSEAMRTGSEEIVCEYLRRHSSIDLVLMFTIIDDGGALRKYEKRFSATRAVRKKWADAELGAKDILAEIADSMNEGMTRWPQPSSNAKSAAENVKEIDYNIGAWGGLKQGGSKLKMSALAVQRLLAGEIDIAEFNRAHGWTDDNPFASALENGRTIRRVNIEKTDRLDDDWMEFQFGDDAARQPFK